jgi:hypothetical protein
MNSALFLNCRLFFNNLYALKAWKSIEIEEFPLEKLGFSLDSQARVPDNFRVISPKDFRIMA